MQDKLPLTIGHQLDSLLAWSEDKITHGQFIADVLCLAEQLPDAKYVFNLCENRYHFMVGFAAAMVRGQTNLLPPSRSGIDINKIASQHVSNYALLELKQDTISIPQFLWPELNNQPSMDVPMLDRNHLAAIVFTSGSTGEPKPNHKLWRDLIEGTRIAAERFQLEQGQYQIVATVPPQHMYGLETSVLLPWLTGNAVYAERPFYPADIQHSLNNHGGKRVLVTTPVHLRACVGSKLEWPKLEYIISATAPLSKALALDVEQAFQCPVLEIYGCTETGSMASRRTLDGTNWKLYPSVRLEQDNQRTFVTAPHLSGEVDLNDVIEITDDTHFQLLGRNADMINIAGKRGSIGDLNQKLQSIQGVEQGVFFQPDSDDATQRLTAFIVAPDVRQEDIIKSLSSKVDPVFLPRPLFKVDSLPYNETGKLTRTALQEFYNKLRR